MTTNVLSARKIQHQWHLVDAKDQVLGRLASQVARLLMGKNKPEFVPYLDCGDNVVVINAQTIRVTGKKEEQKEYVRHSGYPGGFRKATLAQVRQKAPENLIIHAVHGMMPKNRLGRRMIKKLHVYSGALHPFADKLKTEKEN